MVKPSPTHPDSALVEDTEAAILLRNGITRIPADHYHVDGYRYTSLADALAQVRRGAHDRGLLS